MKITTLRRFLSPSFKLFNQSAVTEKPQKTETELKIERLMERYPDYIKKADPKLHPELYDLRTNLEDTYKYHQGNKPFVHRRDMPERIYGIMWLRQANYKTTNSFAKYILDFEGFIPEDIFAAKFHEVCHTKETTPEFYQVVVPEAKKFVANANRECIQTLYRVAVGAALINLQDEELWALLEKKLVDDRLYRYLTLEMQAKLVESLALADRVNKNLFNALEKVFIKHRKGLALQPDWQISIAKAYTISNLGSELLFKTLEDPTISIPGVDPQIPEMKRHNYGYVGHVKQLE